MTTDVWARSLNISTASTPPEVDGYDEECPFSAWEIAVRIVILQGVVAVAYGVDPEPVRDWYLSLGLWDRVSPQEQHFLLAPSSVEEDVRNRLRWHQETEWTLLWVIGKVEWLGLPIRQCDTTRLVDEIMPTLGSDIDPFLSTAEVRPPGPLLAEDDRHYDLWCHFNRARREGLHQLPTDLNPQVLYQRRYAFEWLQGIQAWDDVHCDA